MNDEFYIGWQDKAAPTTAWAMRRTVILLLLGALAVGGTFAASQRLIGNAVFEWGNVKAFSGVLVARPTPQLLVPRPGSTTDANCFSSYLLVAPWKFGLKAESLAPFDGKTVSLKGTLIYRGGQTMIEVVENSLTAAATHAAPPLPEKISLGRQTLIGEIVDSKCFLGVMNPGQLTPHRACAIRCISGGIPPVLLVRSINGAAIYFLLVDADGSTVNKKVLDYVAEPLEISGEVEKQGELLILRADPKTFHRLP